jgi:hypothetical protein
MDGSTTAHVLEWLGKFGAPFAIIFGLMWWGYKLTPQLFNYLRERDTIRAKTETAWNELAGKFCIVLDRNTTVIEKAIAIIERHLEKKP